MVTTRVSLARGGGFDSRLNLIFAPFVEYTHVVSLVFTNNFENCMTGGSNMYVWVPSKFEKTKDMTWGSLDGLLMNWNKNENYMTSGSPRVSAYDGPVVKTKSQTWLEWAYLHTKKIHSRRFLMTNTRNIADNWAIGPARGPWRFSWRIDHIVVVIWAFEGLEQAATKKFKTSSICDISCDKKLYVTGKTSHFL